MAIQGIQPAAPPVNSCDWLRRQTAQGIAWIKDIIRRIVEWASSFFVSPASQFHPISRLAIRKNLTATQFDPAMLQLQAFLKNLSVMIGTSVNNNVVGPFVQNYATNSGLSQDLQSAWNTVSASLAELIAKEVSQAFDNALASATGEVKLLLTWLIYGKKGQDSKSQLAQVLAAKYKDRLAANPNLVNQFVNWLCDKTWLTGSSAIPSPQAACPDGAQDSGLLQSLLTTSLQTLIDNMGKAFLQKAFAALSGQAASILKETIATNSAIIGETIALRASSLLQTTSPLTPQPNQTTIYQQTYDQSVEILLKQINAIINTPKNSNPTTFAQSFSQSDACDPTIRSMLSPPQGSDPTQYRTQLEQKLCSQAASRLLALLLPNETSQQENLTLSTPGIVMLWRTLQFPQELQTVFSDLLTWPEDLFPSGPPASVDLLTSAVKYFIEKGAASILNDQLQAGLTLGLQKGLNLVVPPEYLNMWMVQGAFPAIFQALVQALLSNVLLTADNEVAQSFLPFTAANCNRSAAYGNLTPILYKYVYRVCRGIDLQKAGMNEGNFATSMSPYLNQVIDYVVQNTVQGKASLNDVKKCLTNFTQPVEAGDNDMYGQLLTNLMFKVGDINLLGNQKLAEIVCQLFLKNVISKAVTGALYPLRTNEQLLVGGILKGINGVLSTQQQVDALLFGPPQPVVDVSKQLTTQLTQTSQLIDSLTRQAIGQLPNHAHWYSSPFEKLGVDGIEKLLPSQGDLTTTITRVYTVVLGNRFLNENLYIQLVNSILTALENASNTLDT